MDEDLVDRIYEAAALPDLWPQVLDRLNEVGNGFATFLFTATRNDVRWTYSQRGAYCNDYMAEGWPARTDRPFRLLAARHAGFLGDLDVYTREEMDREPVFTEFMRPRGLGWGAATAIELPCENTIIFNVERRWETGPVDAKTIARLDALRPHLARAALVSARLALERARAATMTLELIGLPAAIVSRGRAIIDANGSMAKLIPDVLQDRMGRLMLANPAGDRLLQAALESLAGRNAPVSSIPTAASEDHPPHIVHVIPIRRQALDVFSSAGAIVIAMPIASSSSPSSEVLQGLFDLTAAEARVARGVTQCQTLDELALGIGVSKETIRSQLKAVFAKTGVGRQNDLVALLSGKQLPSATQK
jgi:DNA-binding CsgD family transcriptional regulator